MYSLYPSCSYLYETYRNPYGAGFLRRDRALPIDTLSRFVANAPLVETEVEIEAEGSSLRRMSGWACV